MRVVLAIVVFTGFGLSARADDPWKEYTSRAGKFKVLLPGTPKVQEINEKAGDGSDVKITNYRTQAAGGLTVIVATSDFAEQYAKVPADKILDNAREGALTRSRGTLVREKKLRLGDHPGREYVIRFPKEQGVIRARAYLVGARQYSLLVAGKDEKAVTSREANAFMESLKLTK